MKQIILSTTLILTVAIAQAQNAFQVDAVYAEANEFEVNSTEGVLSSLPENDLLTEALAEEAAYEESDLDENIEYLDEVQNPTTPTEVRKFQLMASLYDVTQSYIFDGRNEPFEMVFKTDKGTIKTTYNWKGEVLTSEEKFRNVALPNDIARKVLSNHEGWRIVRTNYSVSYVKDEKAEKIYAVQITDGKKKKKISLDAEGIVL